MASALWVAMVLMAEPEARKLSLREALAATVAHNPSVTSRAVDVTEAVGLVSAIERRWLPIPSVSARYGWAQSPVLGPLYSFFSPYDQSQTSTLTLGVGLAGELPVTSTRYTLGVNFVRGTDNRLDQLLGTTANLSPTLEINQPLLRGGLGRPYLLVLEQLREGKRAASAAERLAWQSGVLRAATTFLDAARVQRVIDVRLQAVQSAEQMLAATEKLLASGRTVAESVTASKAELVRRHREVIEARAAELRATTTMLESSFLDQDPSFTRGPLTLVLEPYETERPPADALVAEVLAGHPQLETLRARLAQAAAGLDLALNQRLPDVSLSGRVGFAGIGGDPNCVGGVLRDGVSPCGVSPSIGSGALVGAVTTLPRFPLWEVGARVSVPIGDDAVWSQLASAEARLKRAQLELDATQTRLSTEARTRLAAYDLGVQRLQTARTATELSEQTHNQVTKRFQLGGATIFDLLRALDQLYSAREALTGAEVDLTRLALELDEIRPGRLLQRFDLSSGGTP